MFLFSMLLIHCISFSAQLTNVQMEVAYYFISMPISVYKVGSLQVLLVLMLYLYFCRQVFNGCLKYTEPLIYSSNQVFMASGSSMFSFKLEGRLG